MFQLVLIKMADTNEGSVKRFVKVSSTCVSQAIQNLGIQTSAEVSSALVDDVSFRLRQVTETACQFMKHAKRKCLITDDFDKALKWSRIEPLHGHQTSFPAHFSPTQNTNVFIVEDNELDLTFESFVSVETPPDTSPRVEASWLAVEGASVSTTDTDRDQSFVELKRESNEPNEKYLSVLMEALTGDQEDLRKVALTDLQKNSAIANILPHIIAYLQETLHDWLQFPPQQLTRLLKLSLALFQNPHLFLEPYLLAVYPGLKSVLFDTTYLVCAEDTEHWAVRELAASSMAVLLHRCGSLNGSVTDLHSSLHQLLGLPDPPLASLYGAVLTLCHLPGGSLVTVLYPHLEELVVFLNRQLESKSHSSRKEDALRVYEALLFSAELLLTGGYQLEESQPSPSAAPDPKPSQPSLPKEPSSLFASTSFGLSAEASDMELEHSSTHTDSSPPAGKIEKTGSLYHHLTDLFGESLLLRLSTHPQFIAPSPTLTPHKHTLPEPNHSHSRNSPTSPALQNFLKEEGFKPLKVELPLSNASHPPKRNRWTLVVPRTKLPINGNILEEWARKARHQRHRRERRLPPAAVFSKGACASYRRHNCRSASILERVCVHVQCVWL